MESEPPAAPRPRAMRSAIPGITLFCANLLVAVILAISYTPSYTSMFAAPSPRRRPAPTATALATPTFDISALPGATPTSATTRSPTRTPTLPPAYSPTTRPSVAATATVTPRPQPTASPTPTAIPLPTADPTVSSGGG